MGIVISVTNQKGGVGKTTTATQLGLGLSMFYGCKVLLVDMDYQCNMSYILGSDGGEEKTILEGMTGEASIDDIIVHKEKYDFVPCSPNMSAVEQFVQSKGSETILKRLLDPVRSRYDYIVIDSPPTLGLTTINIMAASDGLIIPAIADIFSLQGIGQLFQTITAVREYLNAELKVYGILLTRHTERLNHSRSIHEMLDETAAAIGTEVYQTSIREAVGIREASTQRSNIFSYAPRSKQAEDYKAFVTEFMNDMKSERGQK